MFIIFGFKFYAQILPFKVVDILYLSSKKKTLNVAVLF